MSKIVTTAVIMMVDPEESLVHKILARRAQISQSYIVHRQMHF